MIKVMSRVLLMAVFFVSMTGWSMAQTTKPEQPSAPEQVRPEHPKGESAKPEHPKAEPAADTDLHKQIDGIKGVIPKFAIPMREVGDRFQNMYFAAKEGNWGLAAYMSKYMNGAMKPASLTKPAEYAMWQQFYENTFAPVNKAIQAQDWKAFEKEYTAVIKECNGCHDSMGYGFIKVIKMKTAADTGIKYPLKSKATDVPK